MIWRPSAEVLGCSLPRRLTTASLAALAQVLEGLVVQPQPHDLWLDTGRVEEYGCDSLTLAKFERRVVELLRRHPEHVKHLTLVGGRGVSQSALLGAVVASRPAYAWSVVTHLQDALEVSGPGSTPPAWSGTLLGALNSELTPLGVVSRVRAELGNTPHASLETVAQRLGLTPRSLQRALADAATTFANERIDVRLTIAAARLERTDQKSSAIATEIGYQSPSRFVQVFTSRFGVTPGRFRAQCRERVKLLDA